MNLEVLLNKLLVIFIIESKNLSGKLYKTTNLTFFSAAATASASSYVLPEPVYLQVKPSTIASKSVTVKVDRPSLFVIRASGVNLFMGRLSDPAVKRK